METLLASILGFFAFGTLGFWLLIIALSVVYTNATESDHHGWAIFSTIVAGLLMWYPLMAVIHHWHILLIGVAVFGILGGAWSTFRWFRFCREYIAENSNPNVSYTKWVDGERAEMNEAEMLEALEDYYKDKLKPSEHKSRLIGWIIYWPWSLVWNIAGDFFTGIYDALVNVYKNIAQSVIRKAIGGKLTTKLKP